jgi:hypothetical protein
LTDVSEELTASFRAVTIPIALMMEAVSTSQKIGQYLPDYTVQHSRKQPYSYWDVHYSLQIIKVMDYLRKSNYLKPEIYIITKLSLD